MRLGSYFADLRPQQRALGFDGRQLRTEGLAVSSREIGDGPFHLRHAGAAVPAGGQVDANLSGAACVKFAVRRQEQLLIRYVEVIVQHNFISHPRVSASPATASETSIPLLVIFRAKRQFPGSERPRRATAGNTGPLLEAH